MFATLSDRLTATFKNLRGKGRLSEADVDATVREIRRALLDADVALPVVREFAARVRERALSEEVSQALNPAQQVVKIVNDELVTILGGEQRRLTFAKNPPTVIMLAGLQGAGKTTLAGKLGHWLKEQGHAPLLVAADLQRPNAVTQLQVVGERAGVTVYAPEPGNGVGDPVDVARRAMVEARSKQFDVVVVDTAGRLGVDAEMMQQAADIRAAVQPDEVLFVVDAMIGQDAVQTAQAFQEGVGITGVVLTKLDGDARGGAALSVASVTGRPVMFASTGEKLTEFEPFHPDRMASRILDMGDVLTLIEQAEKAFEAEHAEEMARKFGAGEDFTFDDFLQQMQGLRKMGSMKKMLGMLPGMGEMREQLESFDEREIDRIEAIVRSMTPQERYQPKIINGSRRARIARGSGVTVTDVNQLLERFADAQKMMRQLRRTGGIPGHARHGRRPRRHGRLPRHGRRQQEVARQAAGAGQEGQGQVRQPGQARPAGAGVDRRHLGAGRGVRRHRTAARGRPVRPGRPATRFREVPRSLTVGRWTTQLGEERVSVDCLDSAAEHVPWLLQRLTAAHEQGVQFTAGAALRFGWSVLVLRREADGRLQVCEPDFARDPTADLRPEISTTLRVQAATRDLMAYLGVLDPVSVAYDQTVRVVGDVLDSHQLHLVRSVGDARSSGWFATGALRTGADALADPVPMPVHRLLVHRPTLVPALALPVGSVVTMEGDRLVSVLDSDDRPLMTDGVATRRVRRSAGRG